MAERVETIRLTAQVSNYLAGMEQARRATAATGTAAQKLAQQGQAMTTLGHTMLAAGTVVAAGVALAVKTFADFDAQMSQVKTLSGATADEMTQLAHAAETLGQKIGISATQAADAQLELVKAGISVSDILGGALQGSLQLAAAGQIDVADATSIATIALTQFGLKGKDVPHVADLLAAGADKALGGVSDLGEALKSGGLVASQFGVSLDETVGTLSAFANAGLLGETAGTDLRQMLLKLAAPSAEAEATMKKYGITVYDTSGKFVGITALAGQLKSQLGGLSEAQRNAAEATIFGSRAINGANVLYKEGAAGIADWTSKVNDTGFAAHQAAGKMDNLNGDISKLGAAFQTDLIETGGTANNVLRDAVQILTVLVKAYGNLPAPVQGAALAVGAVVAMVTLAGGAFVTLIPRLAATKNALKDLKLNLSSTAAAGGLATGALTLLIAILSAVAQHEAKVQSEGADLADTFDKLTGATTAATRATVAKALQDAGAFDIAKKLGISQKELTDAVFAQGDAYAYLAAQHSGFQGGAITDLKKLKPALEDQQASLAAGRDAWNNQAAAADSASSSTETAASAYQDAAQQASNLTDQISQLVDEINKANGVGQDAVSSNAAYQKALADADAAVKEYLQTHRKSTAALDESTVAGSANAEMLANLAKKNEDAASSQFALDNNTDAYIAALTSGHQAIVDHALALGATADQAEAIADKVAAIPSEKQVEIIADTAQAAKTLDQFIASYGHLSGTIMFRSQNLPAGTPGTYASGGYTPAGAHLAVVGEKGTEFVSTAATVANPNNRAALEYMHAGGDISRYGSGGYTGLVAPLPQFAKSKGSGGSTSKAVEQTFNVNGVEDPTVFAALVAQSSAARLRGALR